jgi:hypothetical protein
MPAHFRGLEGANTLETESFRLANLSLDLATSEGAMAAIYGDAGTGKSYAVQSALDRQTDIPKFVFDLAGRPTPKQIAYEMLREITGIPYREPLYRLDARLIETISKRRSILVFEEAQRYNLDGFEYVRHVSDEVDRRNERGEGERSAFVFVGGHGCASTLLRYPMLESRISYWVEFTPLTDDDVLAQMRNFHPLYADTDAEDLLLINHKCTHGNLRDWADFTRIAKTLCQRRGTPLDTEVIWNVLALMQRPAA